MTVLSIRKVPERCLWGALLFCTVYQSYRYPLQLNYSGTSPTYSDTPVTFQIAKFFVTLILCLIATFYIPSRSFPYKKWVLAGLALCMSAYPALKVIGAESSDATIYLNVAFWPLAALILVISSNAITIAALNRYFRFVFFYALASTAIEVFLFLTIGRLPALAYADSFSVRFGGFLDDPNGFAALLYMLVGWAHYHFSGMRRLLAEAALALCLLLTQSYTALVFLGLFALVFAGNRLIRRPRPLLAMSLGAILSAILISVWSPLTGLITTPIELKASSVDVHLSQVTSTTVSAGVEWLLGGPSYVPYESWWVGSLVNFGIPWYLLSLVVLATLVVSTSKAFRHARSSQYKALMSGMLLLSCYFLVGNINLPFHIVFPINFLFFFFSFLVFFERIREDGVEVREI